MSSCVECGVHEACEVDDIVLEKLGNKQDCVKGKCRHCVFKESKKSYKKMLANAVERIGVEPLIALYAICLQITDPKRADRPPVELEAMAQMAMIGCAAVLNERGN